MALLGTAVALSGCGQAGRLVVELTGEAPEGETLRSVTVTVSQVDAQVAESEGGQEGWVTVGAQALELDLLRLLDDQRVSLGALDLSDGRVTQVRLFLDTSARNEVVLRDGTTCRLDTREVSGAGTMVLHPFPGVDVEANNLTRVVLGFDVGESLERMGACTYRLKPVITLVRVTREPLSAVNAGG
jgi:hypothetical protein